MSQDSIGRNIMSCVRYIIPRFAQYIARSSAFTTSFVPRNKLNHSLVRNFSTTIPKPKKETITVYFIDRDGDKVAAIATVGTTFLDVAIHNDVELEGACEGTLACSTCHLIFEQKDYDKLPQEPTDEELDMLDLAYGLADTSRLGCQIIVTKDMDGLTVRVPAGVADAREP
ncbi:2Fe-2S ferredoxin-like isoform X2 [Ruditapes philippinarum]|uniref:2Fe-2S ferredoxin-like isoform X2 n=1 Tax=Ruditapes philippinarum TaxID=129788 RepID=UPI00295B9964|nr:2Fe-2S ferredoxin-like isoform X2 [Ruditapes philippinarum]